MSKYVGRPNRPPSQAWRTFLDNHLRSLVAVDFFTGPTVPCTVLFVFVVLAHHRRRVVHGNVTDTPTAAWTAQPIVEAFPGDDALRRSLIDVRAGIAGGGAGEVLRGARAFVARCRIECDGHGARISGRKRQSRRHREEAVRRDCPPCCSEHSGTL